MSTDRLPPSHLLLALAIVAVWGTNFVVIKVGLVQFPPFLFAALRFLFALLPALFLLRRPAVPWAQLAAYGVLIGVGQFGILFWAMNGHITPGLASLVIQSQVFFTIALAMWFGRERIRRFQVVALALAAAGIGVIAAHTDGATTLGGVALVLLAALCWAGGNIVSRRAAGVNMLAYVVWSSMFALPPLLLASWWFEGGTAITRSLSQATPSAWAAVLWQSVGNTLFGYAAWAWLLSRHAAATVSPMALLVPMFGMGAAAAVLGEPLAAWKVAAALLVIAGLVINIGWPRWQERLAARRLPG